MGAHDHPKGREVPAWLKVAYCALNVASASAIVFANKAVFQIYGFTFVVTLTFIHTVFTWAGMSLMACLGFFQAKQLSALSVAPLALGYIGYIVLNNLSLNLNTVGFYQILKIAIAPTIMAIEFLMFSKRATTKVTLSVLVVCAGVTVATVTDSVAIKNGFGLTIGLSSVLVTALYQIWAGTKQKELQANSSQLLQAYTPQAIVMLLFLMPAIDNFGIKNPTPDTVLGYQFRPAAVAAIVVSAVLGVLVSLSTFLVIGATSSLTYNIVGHLKTVAILSGGCVFFGDAMPLKKFLGVCVTMCGIAWYTYLTFMPAAEPATKPKLDSGHDFRDDTSTTPSLRSAEAGVSGFLGQRGGRALAKRDSDSGAEPEREPLLLPQGGSAKDVA